MARTKLQTASRTPLEVGKRIDDLVSKEETAKLVSCFFESAGPFAGSTFVTLQPVKKFQLTASDLVATSLLDIRFGPNAVRGILEDDATELAGLLKEVKPDVDLWDNRATFDASRDALGSPPPISRRWEGDCESSSLASDLASIPVVDRIVIKGLEAAPNRYWRVLQEVMADPKRRIEIDRLGDGLDLPPEVTTLRLLDAAVWMWGSESKQREEVSGGTWHTTHSPPMTA